jgi:hypothetical protein
MRVVVTEVGGLEVKEGAACIVKRNYIRDKKLACFLSPSDYLNLGNQELVDIIFEILVILRTARRRSCALRGQVQHTLAELVNPQSRRPSIHRLLSRNLPTAAAGSWQINRVTGDSPLTWSRKPASCPQAAARPEVKSRHAAACCDGCRHCCGPTALLLPPP